MNYKAEINLLKITGAVRHTNSKTGVEMLIIPIKGSGLYNQYADKDKGTEDKVTLDVFITERREPRYGNTHYIKQSVTSETYKSMSEDQRKAIPFIGDMKPVQQTQQQSTQPTLQQTKETLQAAGFIEDANDDLPF